MVYGRGGAECMELVVNIRKQLRNFELQADFTAKDEVFALLGASGCGKSMTLKCIAGIETPDDGYIRIGETVVFDDQKKINLPPQQRHTGYLFQNYALFPNMTIAENIAFVVRGGMEEKKKRIRENIQRFSLDGLEDAYPAALSGGQQQRAAFARILASDAGLLLLDEPFSALDSYLKWQLEQELGHVLKEYGGSAVFVSHDRGEVYRLCSRAAVMHEGRMEVVAPKKELFEHPQTLAGALLTGCKNVSAAYRLDEQRIFARDWGIALELPAGQSLPADLGYAGLRAHFFELAEGPGRNVFAAEIVQVIENTFSYLVMFRPEGATVKESKPLRWEVDKAVWQEIAGAKLYVRFPADKIIYLKKGS